MHREIWGLDGLPNPSATPTPFTYELAHGEQLSVYASSKSGMWSGSETTHHASARSLRSLSRCKRSSGSTDPWQHSRYVLFDEKQHLVTLLGYNSWFTNPQYPSNTRPSFDPESTRHFPRHASLRYFLHRSPCGHSCLFCIPNGSHKTYGRRGL